MRDHKYRDLIGKLIERYRRAGINSLNPYQRAVVCAAHLDVLIIKDGLLGFYSSSWGAYANEAVTVLLLIGCNESARIIHQANELFPGAKPPVDMTERRLAIENLGNKKRCLIARLGRAYLDRPDALGDKLEVFIKAHLKDMVEGIET